MIRGDVILRRDVASLYTRLNEEKTVFNYTNYISLYKE